MIHLGTVEKRVRAVDTGDGKRVLGEGVQDSARIFEELERLVTGVGDGRGDGRVLQQKVDDNLYYVLGDGGGGADDGRRGDEDDNGSTERRGEHRDGGGEGGRGDDSNEDLGTERS